MIRGNNLTAFFFFEVKFWAITYFDAFYFAVESAGSTFYSVLGERGSLPQN